MKGERAHVWFPATVVLLASLAAAGGGLPTWAAGHREAPAVALTPGSDVTDVYAFRSWEDPTRVVLIMNVLPGQEPADGPIYYHFDEDVVYRIHVDNDRNGVADDVVYEVSFETEHRPALGTEFFVLPFFGNPAIPVPELTGITALDGPGSDGLTLRQVYTVTEIRDGKRTRLFQDRRLVAVPQNVGPLTMPDYEGLAAQGIYRDPESGIRVFSGSRAETYYADRGALFDGATFRRFPPLLAPEEDADDTTNAFGVNRFSGNNVNSIVIEVPADRVTHDGQPADATAIPTIGVYASVSREKHAPSVHGSRPAHRAWLKHGQVSRMGNPMVNTLIIDTPFKDQWNLARPEHDARFQEFLRNPSLTRPPSSLIFGIPVPTPPRADLMTVLLKYPGQALEDTFCGTPCADLLRLDLRVPPTPPEAQGRLGALLGGDPAGFPNGRRPNDDVTDLMVRIIGGPNLIAARVGDGVNFLDGAPGAGTFDGPGYGTVPGNRLDVTPNGIAREFPFLPTPHDGRFHRHHGE